MRPAIKSFTVCVEEDIRERETEEFGKGRDSKVKLGMYRMFVGRGNLKGICMAIVGCVEKYKSHNMDLSVK